MERKYKTKSESNLGGEIVRYIFGCFLKIFDMFGAEINESDILVYL